MYMMYNKLNIANSDVPIQYRGRNHTSSQSNVSVIPLCVNKNSHKTTNIHNISKKHYEYYTQFVLFFMIRHPLISLLSGLLNSFQTTYWILRNLQKSGSQIEFH